GLSRINLKSRRTYPCYELYTRLRLECRHSKSTSIRSRTTSRTSTQQVLNKAERRFRICSIRMFVPPAQLLLHRRNTRLACNSVWERVPSRRTESSARVIFARQEIRWISSSKEKGSFRYACRAENWLIRATVHSI